MALTLIYQFTRLFRDASIILCILITFLKTLFKSGDNEKENNHFRHGAPVQGWFG
jgi:hypothetical protein